MERPLRYSPAGGSKFEDWDDRGRKFDLLVAASSWHGVDPLAGWRRLDAGVREPLPNAVAERIRTRMGERASRRYLSVLRVGQVARD
jgi:hypothetical protein